mgnify:CR=1 FL=1
MNTARKNCIWYDQCGSECQGKCDDYSPADDAGENEVLFYQGGLKENAQGVMCLNRENRRALKKKLRDKGSRTLAADVLESLGNEIDKKIRDGDLVTLNVDQIIARKDYPRMQGEYRQFVESSRDKVFVAHPHRERPDGFSALIELEGVETWLFWYGDLIQVENIQTEEGE